MIHWLRVYFHTYKLCMYARNCFRKSFLVSVQTVLVKSTCEPLNSQ